MLKWKQYVTKIVNGLTRCVGNELLCHFVFHFFHNNNRMAFQRFHRRQLSRIYPKVLFYFLIVCLFIYILSVFMFLSPCVKLFVHFIIWLLVWCKKAVLFIPLLAKHVGKIWIKIFCHSICLSVTNFDPNFLMSLPFKRLF